LLTDRQTNNDDNNDSLGGGIYTLVMVAGLWWGYTIGLTSLCVCYIVFVTRLNWKTEAHKVSTFFTLLKLFILIELRILA